MTKFTFALTGAAALALAACSSGDDAAENVATNEPVAELDQSASDAANDAANAEAAALGDQLNELQNAPAPADNAVNPSDAQEQNVAGM